MEQDACPAVEAFCLHTPIACDHLAVDDPALGLARVDTLTVVPIDAAADRTELLVSGEVYHAD
jgi:hypothetical protein